MICIWASSKYRIIFGDLLTSGLNRVLASISGGDDSLIKSLIENENLNQFVRSAALDALLCLVRAGLKTREETIDYLKKLFSLMDKDESFVPTALVQSSLELNAPELHSEIRRYYDDNLVELGVFKSRKEAEQTMLKGTSQFSEGTEKYYDLITDAISEIEHYYNPQVTNFGQIFSSLSSPSDPPYELAWDSDKKGTFKHETPKAGANDPCPCGSGRKYKKCCQNKK